MSEFSMDVDTLRKMERRRAERAMREHIEEAANIAAVEQALIDHEDLIADLDRWLAEGQALRERIFAFLLGPMEERPGGDG